MATPTTYKRRRGLPRAEHLSKPDYPYMAKLPDGRTLFIEVPGRWTTNDRDGSVAFLPEAVRLIDRVCAMAMSLDKMKHPPSPGYIVTLREGLGLTQKELAERIGVDKMTVSRWERGTLRPSPESLRALETVRRKAVRKGVVVTG